MSQSTAGFSRMRMATLRYAHDLDTLAANSSLLGPGAVESYFGPVIDLLEATSQRLSPGNPASKDLKGFTKQLRGLVAQISRVSAEPATMIEARSLRDAVLEATVDPSEVPTEQREEALVWLPLLAQLSHIAGFQLLVGRTVVISLVSTVELLVASLLAECYGAWPKTLGQVSFSGDQLDSLSSEELIAQAISLRTDSDLRKGLIEAIRGFTTWGIDIPKLCPDIWPDFKELIGCRNCLVHNDGIVDEQYGLAKDYRPRAKLGERLETTVQYLEHGITACRRFGGLSIGAVWPRVAPQEIEACTKTLSAARLNI